MLCQQIKEVCSWLFSAHPLTGSSCVSTLSNCLCRNCLWQLNLTPWESNTNNVFSDLYQLPKTALQRAQYRGAHQTENKGLRSDRPGLVTGDTGHVRYEMGKATPACVSPSSYSPSRFSVLQNNNTSVIRSIVKGCIRSVV